MASEILYSLENIERSIWDGHSIGKTLDCETCPFFRKAPEDERCYWGLAWKILSTKNKSIHCLKINQSSPRQAALDKMGVLFSHTKR